MLKFGLTVFLALIVSTVEVAGQQLILRGGYVSQEFLSCNTGTCGASAYCCKFTNSYRQQETDYYCMSDFQTGGVDTGVYQDQINYPFERFDWDCGSQFKRYSSNWSYSQSAVGRSDQVIPEELINYNFWVWTWLILFVYFLSAGGWFLGYLLYFPITMVLHLYNVAVWFYSTGIMLFESPQRLQFDEWLLYPVRRLIVEAVIILMGYFWLGVPLLNLFALPCLGLWYVNDFLDYSGWDQVTSTLGIPFNGYDYRDPSSSHDNHGHSRDGHTHTHYDHSHDSNNNVVYY